jgi:hypothetical protein
MKLNKNRDIYPQMVQIWPKFWPFLSNFFKIMYNDTEQCSKFLRLISISGNGTGGAVAPNLTLGWKGEEDWQYYKNSVSYIFPSRL